MDLDSPPRYVRKLTVDIPRAPVYRDEAYWRRHFENCIEERNPAQKLMAKHCVDGNGKLMHEPSRLNGVKTKCRVLEMKMIGIIGQQSNDSLFDDSNSPHTAFGDSLAKEGADGNSTPEWRSIGHESDDKDMHLQIEEETRKLEGIWVDVNRTCAIIERLEVMKSNVLEKMFKGLPVEGYDQLREAVERQKQKSAILHQRIDKHTVKLEELKQKLL